MRVADADLQAWWICARVKLVSRGGVSEACLPRLDRRVESGLCVVFIADMGKTWVMLSPVKKGLNVEFLWSEKQGVIKRCLPLLKCIAKDSMYKQVFAMARTAGHKRLYKQNFKQVDDSLFLIVEGV